MAELKIKATFDGRSAKAGLRELSQEEASRQVQERESNVRRQQDAVATAKAQIAAAREAGSVSKQEIEELKRVHRIAVADMKAANKELSAARRDAARADRQELQRQLAAERQDRAAAARLDRFRQIEEQRAQAPEDLRRELLAQRGRVVRSGGRRSRVQRSVNPEEEEDDFGRYGSFLVNRVAGPAALIASVHSLVSAVRSIMSEVKELREKSGDAAIDRGNSISAFRRRASANGLGNADINAIVRHASQTQQYTPVSDYLSRVSSELDKSLNAQAAISAVDASFSDIGAFSTPDERVARGARRAARTDEINGASRGVQEARRKNVEELYRIARESVEKDGDLSIPNWLAAKMAESVTLDSSIRNLGFSGPEAYRVHLYNQYVDNGGGGKKITVSLDPESIRQLVAPRSDSPLVGH
jgi:hypothetical protein